MHTDISQAAWLPGFEVCGHVVKEALCLVVALVRR